MYQPEPMPHVTYQSKDFRFRNDTGSPVCIKTTTSGGKLTVQIFGKRSGPPVKVKIEREVVGVTDFKVIRKGDPELLLGKEKVDHEGSRDTGSGLIELFTTSRGSFLSGEAFF